MKKNSISTYLQTLFGVTRHELLFAGILVSGIVIYATVDFIGFGRHEQSHDDLAARIYNSLDSLSDVYTTTYTGIDESGEAIPALARADTVVQNKSSFPQSKKKELPSGLVNLNKASKTQLMALPGVGEKTALNIIEYRALHPFSKPSDIMNIKGIGIKKFEKMKPFIEVK